VRLLSGAAHGPAEGLPNTHVSIFTRVSYNEAIQSGYIAVSMKRDWKRIFAESETSMGEMVTVGPVDTEKEAPV
jgi:hypothetical protein